MTSHTPNVSNLLRSHPANRRAVYATMVDAVDWSRPAKTSGVGQGSGLLAVQNAIGNAALPHVAALVAGLRAGTSGSLSPA